MTNKKHIIYYFTGTGNSFYVAKKLASKFIDQGEENVSLINMGHLKNEQKIIVDECDTVGFVYPTYYYSVPNIVRRVLTHISFSNTPYVYLGVTAGSSIGAAASDANKLLGNIVSFAFKAIMPENYVTLFKVPSKSESEKIIDNAQSSINKAFKIIHSKQFNKTGFGNKISNAICHSFNAVFKNMFANKDKNYIVSDSCVKCGMCKQACSVSNISLDSNGRPVFHHQCEYCMGCINICPVKALDYGKKGSVHRGRYYNPYVKVEELENK